MENQTKKTYLCIENGEEFTVKAIDLDEAKEFAEIYGGSVIKEITQ